MEYYIIPDRGGVSIAIIIIDDDDSNNNNNNNNNNNLASATTTAVASENEQRVNPCFCNNHEKKSNRTSILVHTYTHASEKSIKNKEE